MVLEAYGIPLILLVCPFAALDDRGWVRRDVVSGEERERGVSRLSGLLK